MERHIVAIAPKRSRLAPPSAPPPLRIDTKRPSDDIRRRRLDMARAGGRARRTARAARVGPSAEPDRPPVHSDSGKCRWSELESACSQPATLQWSQRGREHGN